ncbi:tetratricopeptide repeat protein [Marivita sp. S0852]|uniref:tetratricopeptide repeat protein n=1 Tax=Marivita sp. S0852 TaxID=3373893 RepID=UPI003982B63C
MIRLRRIIAASVVAAIGAATAVAAQVTLTPAQMRELAGQAVSQGQASLAYDLSTALIGRNNEDLNAHLIKSRAARDLGRNAEALHHARKAWALAQETEAKYAAAMANAQALSSSGRRTAAQLWLRRAVQLAPNDQLKLRATEDYRYVRRQNPWSTALRFSVSPNSNINNGSRNETSELFDLPFEFELEGQARALSGVEVSAGANIRYRLVDTDRKRTDLQFGLNHRTYVLSSEAKDIAPDAEGSDFAITSTFIGLRETYRLPAPNAQLGWNMRLGASWYGGEELLRYARLGTNYNQIIGDRGLASVSLTREIQVGQNGRDDAAIWTGRLGYGFSLDSGNRIGLSATFGKATSDTDYLDYTQREIAVQYSLAKPVGSMLMQFGLALGEKTHDRSSLSSDGREETTVKATITAALPDLDFYGFMPTITFRAERTDANIDIYETENYGVQLGIRSAF